MSKCDFSNSFIIPLGNGAWEINPLYKPTPDIASHCPQFTLSTSVNTKPDLETEKAREAFRKNFGSHLFAIGQCKTNTLMIPPPLSFGPTGLRRSLNARKEIFTPSGPDSLSAFARKLWAIASIKNSSIGVAKMRFVHWGQE